MAISAGFNKIAQEGTSVSTDVSAFFKQNIIDMGLKSGSLDGLMERGFASAQNIEDAKARANEKAAASSRDVLFLSLLNQYEADLAEMENNLAEMYGEHFAENLLSDLNEQGLVEEDEYQRIMAISDPKERRQAIAEFVQEKLDSGTITEADLQGHEWAEDWLQSHKKVQQEIDRGADMVRSGELNPNDAPSSVLARARQDMIEAGEDSSSLDTAYQNSFEEEELAAVTSNVSFSTSDFL